jgi:hypothetical protein
MATSMANGCFDDKLQNLPLKVFEKPLILVNFQWPF